MIDHSNNLYVNRYSDAESNFVYFVTIYWHMIHDKKANKHNSEYLVSIKIHTLEPILEPIYSIYSTISPNAKTICCV